MPHTVVFFHAHPDDEALLTSGTMAKLAASGHRVVLVVATSGEAGLASDEFRSDGRLGERRLGELRRSASALRVHRTEILGYADSGLARQPTPPPPAGSPPRLADADIAGAAGRLADILLRERAAVLTTYDARGGYGHPDHLAVHAIGAAAAAIAGTPVVLQATVPRDRLLRAARVVNRFLPASRTVDLAPWEGAYSASSEITHRIDVRGFWRQRRQSMLAHASQATADGGPRTLGVFTRMPGPIFRLVFGHEWYQQAVPAVARAGRPRLENVFDTL